MQIAIAYENVIKLWCVVKRTTQDGKIYFYVNNGAWDGWFQDGIVHVVETKQNLTGARIVWQGEAPFTSWHYNEALEWIRNQVGEISTTDGARDRDYIWIQPTIKVEEYEDDIPY